MVTLLLLLSLTLLGTLGTWGVHRHHAARSWDAELALAFGTAEPLATLPHGRL